MFPTKFVNDAKNEVRTHNAVTFTTELTQKEIVKKILKMGITKFLTPEKKFVSYDDKAFNDNRIIGMPQFLANQGCCAFTKNANQWYLFPIHETELASVGLVGDDLIAWIKFLNDAKVGFKYLYLGEHEAPDKTGNGNATGFKSQGWRSPNQNYHWVAVPKFGAGANKNKPYLHWISLRYLTNSQEGTHLQKELVTKKRLSYYNIPRIAMFLHEKYNLPKHKAYLYAHIANPFYSGWGLAFTDYMGYKGKFNQGYGETTVDYSVNQAAPCVNLTAPQFKALWALPTFDGTMNRMLTNSNFTNYDVVKKIPGLKNLDAPYDPNTLYKLFDNGDYQGFIDHIEKSYNPEGKKPRKRRSETMRSLTKTTKNVKKSVHI